jgi:glutaredoxin
VSRQADDRIIEVFSQSNCGNCRRVEQFLRRRGIGFIVRDVEADASALEVLIAKGYMTTPVTRIGEQWVAGYKPKILARLLSSAGAVIS